MKLIFSFLVAFALTTHAYAQDNTDTVQQQDLDAAFALDTTLKDIATLPQAEMENTIGATPECQLIDLGNGFRFWYPPGCPY